MRKCTEPLSILTWDGRLRMSHLRDHFMTACVWKNADVFLRGSDGMRPNSLSAGNALCSHELDICVGLWLMMDPCLARVSDFKM